MNTKQKKTLLGAIVALIAVGTTIVVTLAAMGQFSKADPVEEVLNAVRYAMKKAGDHKEYKGGVYIRVQEQWLDANKEKTQKEDGDKKKTYIALRKVIVYGAKEDVSAGPQIITEMKNDSEKMIVINKAVKFEDGAISKDKDYPVLEKLRAEVKLTRTITIIPGHPDPQPLLVPVGGDSEDMEMIFVVSIRT